MNIYLYIAAMALTTYLVRMLPLTVFRKPIRSRFVRSFLHYVPYACLAAMTFPAILQDTVYALKVYTDRSGDRPCLPEPESHRRGTGQLRSGIPGGAADGAADLIY